MRCNSAWQSIAVMLLLAACQPSQQQSQQERAHDAAIIIMHDRPDEALPKLKDACEAGIARGCANAAWLMLDKNMADVQTAISYYERSCAMGSGIGCNNLANIYAEGVLVTHDDPKAFHYIRKSCDLGYGVACYRAGYITLVGKLTPRDMNKVRAYYKRACDLGDTVGCYDLGYVYLDVHSIKVTKQPEKAYALFERLCTEERFMKACTTQGHMLLKGEDVAKNTAKAKEIFRMACSEDEPFACNNLASMYEDGSAGMVDTHQAARFSEKACQLSAEFCGEPVEPKCKQYW